MAVEDLPGIPTAAKWVSSDNFRLEVQYNNNPQWYHYRTDRHASIVQDVIAIITPEEYIPPVIVPERVSAYQARVALSRANLLIDVQALMDDPATDAEAKIAWEYATEFWRDSPFIAALAPGLGMTDQQLDELFIAAEKIT